MSIEGPVGGSSAEARRIPDTGVGYQIIADPAVFASTAAAVLARRIAALSEQERVSIALSGGTTPRPVYRALAEEAIDWSRLEVFFVDERLVSFDDPGSNYGMARRALLDHVPIPPERVHPLPAEATDLATALEGYAESLPERLDIVVLGIGSDGHTASLFPGSEALYADGPVARSESPVPPVDRLTLTPPVIQSARVIVMLAQGTEKGDAVRAALAESGDVERCPARLARRGIWILGRDLVGGWRTGRAAAPAG